MCVSGEGRGRYFGALFATDTLNKANLAVCPVQFRRAGWQRQGYYAHHDTMWGRKAARVLIRRSHVQHTSYERHVESEGEEWTVGLSIGH